VDMFLVDVKRWKLIKVEFKTGYESEEYTMHPNDTRFLPPLQDITNCPLMRHLLQLTTEDLILSVKYNINSDEDYIVRMLPKAEMLELYEPAEWCTMEKYRAAIYQSILERKNKRR